MYLNNLILKKNTTTLIFVVDVSYTFLVSKYVTKKILQERKLIKTSQVELPSEKKNNFNVYVLTLHIKQCVTERIFFEINPIS